MAESPGQALSLGKTLRLARLFDPDSGTAVMLPLDHAIEEPDYDQLERPLELIGGLARAGVDAFLLRRGLATFAAGAFAGRAGWVQRITGRSGLSTGLRNQQLVIASVEQALRNGADAVIPTFFIGPESETYLLPQLGALADECSRLGVPLMAEVFPAGGPDAVPYHGPYSVDDLRMAVRVASEEGADVIKTWYPGGSGVVPAGARLQPGARGRGGRPEGGHRTRRAGDGAGSDGRRGGRRRDGPQDLAVTRPGEPGPRGQRDHPPRGRRR